MSTFFVTWGAMRNRASSSGLQGVFMILVSSTLNLFAEFIFIVFIIMYTLSGHDCCRTHCSMHAVTMGNTQFYTIYTISLGR